MISRLLTLLCLLLSYINSASQTEEPAKDLYIIECKFLRQETDIQIYPTCMTPSGNTVDLAAYLNLQLHYTTQCAELGYEGNSFFEILLNGQHTLDTIPVFRELCPEESFKKQVETILKKVSEIHLPDHSNRVLLKVKISLIPRQLRKAEMPIVIQHIPIKVKERRRVNKKARIQKNTGRQKNITN